METYLPHSTLADLAGPLDLARVRTEALLRAQDMLDTAIALDALSCRIDEGEEQTTLQRAAEMLRQLSETT
jgi:hypothetical protein